MDNVITKFLCGFSIALACMLVAIANLIACLEFGLPTPWLTPAALLAACIVLAIVLGAFVVQIAKGGRHG